MAAAVTHLVAEDHTFGEGPPPFSEYLIEESTVVIDVTRSEGDPVQNPEDIRRLTEQERVAVEATISQFGPVRWVTDPDDWRTDGLQPEIEGSAILGVGVPDLDDEGGLVPVYLWCGPDCGIWLTYRLSEVDGQWRVTGTEGPVSIS